MNFPTEPAPDGFLHAWYSEEQAKINGTSLYRRNNGEIVEVSMVSTSIQPPGYDPTYLGLVLDVEHGGWISKGRKSQLKVQNERYTN